MVMKKKAASKTLKGSDSGKMGTKGGYNKEVSGKASMGGMPMGKKAGKGKK